MRSDELISFILNNRGYTVERYFNGWEAEYNDVPMWDYSALFRAFSPETKVKTFQVSKAADLDSLLSDKAFQTATYPQVRDLGGMNVMAVIHVNTNFNY
jgi:pyruvate decarboxylase